MKKLRLALLGRDVSLSDSEKIHRFILGKMGTECDYEKVSVPETEFCRAVERLLNETDGFNVTIPYKRSIFPYLKSIKGDAAAYGSVNTVVSAEKAGYNTDGKGFLLMLEGAGITVRGKSVLVLGAGGAGFPTHVKINCKAEFVLANGAECEPLLRVDQQVMQYFAADVVRGIRAVKEFTGAKRAVICLKEHYHAAVAALQEVLKDADDVELHLLQGYYPAGDEQQIVYEVTGRVVPTGGLPLDVGAVVCNVSTLTNIAAALDGKKVTEKYVTVGGAVKNPVTLRVPVGISLQELMDAAGGPTCDCKYIIGGPCMGRVVDTLDIPVTKTTGGLLAIPKDHPLLERKSPKLNLQLIMSVCCQCSMCTQMCPRNALGLNVQPHKAMRSLASGGDLLGEFNGIFSCCNCGLCTYYACNFGLKPSQVMQTLKSAIASKGVRPRKEVYGPVDGGLENKKVPVERLIARLGIAEYDVPAPMAEKPLTTSCVRIALRMGVGAPSVPVVAVGDKVRKNQLVADIAEKKLGVKMHASISGVVTDITADYIEIRKAAK